MLKKKTLKKHTKYKIKLSTKCMRSHQHENKHKNGKHFRQKLSPQNTRNDVSEHQVFQLFLGQHVPDPSSGSHIWHLRDSSMHPD